MINNPFNFAHSRHARKFSPAYSNDYRKYKPTLRLEYERKCIYCRFPDSVKGYDAFGVEHYRPKSIFPQLETEYSNLFYCCNTCNRRKGNRWPIAVFFPNPDEHVMIEHLRFKKEIIEPITESGRFACEVLQLNEPSTVRVRRTLLVSLSSLENDLVELAKLEKAIRKEFNRGNISEAERDADLLEVDNERQEKQGAIDTIAGRD